MARSKILLAGESWVTTATHIKGFDQFPTVTFHRGADALADALADSDFALTYMGAARDDPSLGRPRRGAGGISAGDARACRSPDPGRPRHGVAAAAGLQRSRVEGGGGASAEGPGRRGRTSSPGDGSVRKGPRDRLNLRHRPALVPPRFRLVGGLRPPVAAVLVVADTRLGFLKRRCRRRGPSANGGNPDGLGRNADTSVEGCER